jgi:cytochrome bd-type quinol oxidase subunit 2
MGALDKLNQVVSILQQHAATIGITVAGLMVAIYAIWIMLDNDTSPAARTERWAKLRKVFICAVIIAGTGAFVQFAQNIGGML